MKPRRVGSQEAVYVSFVPVSLIHFLLERQVRERRVVFQEMRKRRRRQESRDDTDHNKQIF